MLQLNSDSTFHYELLRVLGSVRYGGADVAEILHVADQIEPGNFESWHQHFSQLAERITRTFLMQTEEHYPVSARETLFRAASYFRAADFFLHGNPADPRICSLWRSQTACFNRAIQLLPIAGERITVRAKDFDIPAIFYRASEDGLPRPTLLMCNGYDGSQEEMLHVSGFAALERGINVLTFEGPGQPTVRRAQQLGFIPDWERVVTPLIDYCQAVPEVDPARIALLGYSLGGYLVARSAAFEHRLAAVICLDGIYDVYDSFSSPLPENLMYLFNAGAKDEFNASIAKTLPFSTHLRWAIEQGIWCFKADSAFDFLVQVRKFSLKTCADRIACPVLVCDADDDRFFQGQPGKLRAALGPLAAYHKFTTADAAGEHCHVGASVEMNKVVMGWLENTLSAANQIGCFSLPVPMRKFAQPADETQGEDSGNLELVGELCA